MLTLLPESITLIISYLKILVIGVLKGYDQLLNLVLDEVEEELTGDSASPQIT